MEFIERVDWDSDKQYEHIVFLRRVWNTLSNRYEGIPNLSFAFDNRGWLVCFNDPGNVDRPNAGEANVGELNMGEIPGENAGDDENQVENLGDGENVPADENQGENVGDDVGDGENVPDDGNQGENVGDDIGDDENVPDDENQGEGDNQNVEIAAPEPPLRKSSRTPLKIERFMELNFDLDRGRGRGRRRGRGRARGGRGRAYFVGRGGRGPGGRERGGLGQGQQGGLRDSDDSSESDEYLRAGGSDDISKSSSESDEDFSAGGGSDQAVQPPLRAYQGGDGVHPSLGAEEEEEEEAAPQETTPESDHDKLLRNIGVLKRELFREKGCVLHSSAMAVSFCAALLLKCPLKEVPGAEGRSRGLNKCAEEFMMSAFGGIYDVGVANADYYATIHHVFKRICGDLFDISPDSTTLDWKDIIKRNDKILEFSKLNLMLEEEEG